MTVISRNSSVTFTLIRHQTLCGLLQRGLRRRAPFQEGGSVQGSLRWKNKKKAFRDHASPEVNESQRSEEGVRRGRLIQPWLQQNQQDPLPASSPLLPTK